MDFTSEKLIKFIGNKAKTLKDIAKQFQVSTKEAENEINLLIENGNVISSINGYVLCHTVDIYLCRIVLRKSNFAYVTPVNESYKAFLEGDVRVSGNSLKGYILGDLVYVKADYSGEGKIVGLYKRKDYIAGPIYKNKTSGFLVKAKEVEDTDIKIVMDDSIPSLSDGDLVKCKIVSYTVDTIKVKFEDLLVKHDEVGSDISSIIVSLDAPLNFPSEVLIESKLIPQEVSEKDIIGREDFRSKLIVTIDGDDALDFDDAVEVTKTDYGYVLGVHIADVGHYVKPNSFIDKEAEIRGTSIYVADRVVPMLPKELSNGICSLNPKVDRLTLSLIMNVDESGNVYKSKLVQGVINSKARLTYKEVNNLFDNGDKGNLSSELVEMLLNMKEVSKKIRRRRERNGALDLDSTELKFTLDELGNPTEVAKRVQLDAEKMIEDFMIVANVEIAKLLSELNIPTLYRIHDNPPSDKIENLRHTLRSLNLLENFPSKISSKSLSYYLNNIKDEKTHEIVSTFLLPSLAKAKYSPSNTGHFGLAEENYLHFTSPIRRYPDLIVNRTLHDYYFDKEKFNYSRVYSRLVSLGNLTSECERRATTIERRVDDLESAKYMANHINEEYEGMIINIQKYGMFIELDNGIEGLLSIEDINPSFKYTYVDKHMDIQSTNKTQREIYKLGNKMKVFIKSVDIEHAQVNLYTKEAKEIADSLALYQIKEKKEKEELKRKKDDSRVKKDRKPNYKNSHSSSKKKVYYNSKGEKRGNYSKGRKDARRK